MHRYYFLSLLGFMFTLSVALAAPARPLYEPEEPPKLPKAVVVNVNGTAWLGKYLTINRIFIFEPDGTLSYRSVPVKAAKGFKGAVFKNRGSWKLEGNTLSFELSVGINKLMDFRGTVQDSDTIVGESVTKNGVRTPQTLKRSTVEDK